MKTIELKNVSNGEVISQSCLMLLGTIQPKPHKKGLLSIKNTETDMNNSWPVVNSNFKALVELVPGENNLVLEFGSATHKIMLLCQPIEENLPLRLCILLSADTTLQFDQPNAPTENGIEVTVEKFSFSAKIWQAFLAQQFYVAGLGRRSFELEYERTSTTNTEVSLTPKVHFIKTSKTTAELCDLGLAQQYNGPDKVDLQPSLFEIFVDAIKAAKPFEEPCFVAGLIFDSKWDKALQIVRGHAALGGGIGDFRIGVFGSHWLFTTPKNMGDFIRKLTDVTRLDTRYVSNESVQKGKHYHLASIGLSAFLHEVGHCFDLDHTPQGIMGSHFRDFNKNFLLELENKKVEREKINSKFSRIDLLKLRFHECFRLKSDIVYLNQKPRSPPCFFYKDGKLTITHKYGIVLVIIILDCIYYKHFEYLEIPKTSVEYEQSQLVDTDCPTLSHKKLSIRAYSSSYCDETLNDMESFKKNNDVYFDEIGVKCYKTNYLGYGDPGDLNETTMLFGNPNQKIDEILIRHGAFIDGMEFKSNKETIYKCGGDGGGTYSFRLDDDELITKLEIRCGYLVDGMQIFTNKNRKSIWLGGKGGGLRVIESPPGGKIQGLVTKCNSIMYSISILFSFSEMIN